jgi:hypothetical protein
MKCKNIECSNETTGKRVYCSLSCRNVYVNKYLRNYDKYQITCKEKKNKKEENYLLNPKNCKNCKEIISFDKKLQEFCSHSCSSTYTNPNRKGIKHNMSDEGLKILRDSAFRNFSKLKNTDRDNLKKDIIKNCPMCSKEFTGYKKFCCTDCVKAYKRKDVDEFKVYKQDTNFKFNLADYKEEFDFGLIEKYGWYLPVNRGNNLEGVSRDHMFSIKEGFKLRINPFLIAHPANCKLIKHTDNISKNSKCSITYDELLERINKFEEKYKQK